MTQASVARSVCDPLAAVAATGVGSAISAGAASTVLADLPGLTLLHRQGRAE
ncbi:MULTISPECIES: hypothetical protein [unclassified Agromyces]|uniref:hypothetical protein n=1 Tax=unclassified Agromyces TaxID=2639701 RepID=UPI0030153173